MGKIEEVMLIKGQADLDVFKENVWNRWRRNIDMSLLRNLLWFICGGKS